MSGVDGRYLNVAIHLREVRAGVELRFTTSRFEQGRWAAVATVRVVTDASQVPEVPGDLARVVLTALYGMPYDL